MTHKPQISILQISGVCREWFIAFAILMTALAAHSPAIAGDSKQSTVIHCTVSGGSGAIRQNITSKTKRGSYSGDASDNGKGYSEWVFSGEGLDLDDRIDLFWDLSNKPRATLRVAIDGPVSKPAHLLSISDDTVSAVVLTSDSNSTRTWLFTINFRQKQVLASGMSSNMSGMKGQMIDFSCAFNVVSNTAQLSSSADSWRRTDVND